MKSYKLQNQISLVLSYIVLTILAVIWLFPVLWIILASFSQSTTGFVQTFIPQHWTLANYTGIFNNPLYSYGNWLINTFLIAVFSTIISTIFVLVVSFSLSRLHFKMKKTYMQLALILGMFPGLMSMVSLYYIMKAFNMLNLVGLLLIYVGGAGLGFYIFKGFLDTIPISIDEAAIIDGATKWQLFIHITLPLSKPIIVYTALMAFIGPWLDFLLPMILLGTGSPKGWTVAYGLQNMMTNARGAAGGYFPQFVAGCIIVSVPITILFIIMQRFYVNGITAGADKG